jgi:hypothetical protein
MLSISTVRYEILSEALMLNITRWGSHALSWLHALGLHSPHRLRMKQTAEPDQTRWLHQVFQRAYGRFAQAHPAWVARRFDEQLLRQTALPRLVRRRARERFAHCSSTALALAMAWDAQFGVLAPDEAARAQRFAELTLVAQHFLALFARELAQTAATSAQG